MPALPYRNVLDAAVFSCELGRRKPDPLLYIEAARRLGVEPGACVYVGDGSSNELTGATNVGMTAVMINTPFGTDFRYDAEPSWEGLTIETIEEILSLLDRLGK